MYPGYTLLWWPRVYIAGAYLYLYYTLCSLDTHCYDDPGYILLVLFCITIPYVLLIHIVMMSLDIHCWCLSISLYLMYPGYTLLWWPWVYIAGANLYHYYSNQPTSWGLVAVTIRGSVLFYSSAIWRPDFCSVKTEFRYLYGVDSIELRTLFYLWKMCRDHHWHWKNTKSKSETRKCQFCWYLTCILTIRLSDFFDHKELER